MVRYIFRKRRLLKPPRIKSKTGCPEVDLLTEFHCNRTNSTDRTNSSNIELIALIAAICVGLIAALWD